MENYASISESELRQAGLWVARTRRLSDGRKSRATTRTIDYRANDIFFSKIVDIGKDLFIRKLPVTEIANKYGVNRRTITRYTKRLGYKRVNTKGGWIVTKTN